MPSPRIVVPLDGSDFAARAILAAAVIAHAAGSGLTLLGVASDGAQAASLTQQLHIASGQLPSGTDVAEELVVEADPVATLLHIAADPSRVLFLASHDRMPPTAAILGAVGSRVLERSRRPLFVVGRAATTTTSGSDVAVALDGRHDPEPLLVAAVTWARLLDAPLRVVTVYEPVPADIRDPQHFSRRLGPATDPDVYLRDRCARLDDDLPRGVELVAIPDPVSVSAGLSDHLTERPARLLVAGAEHHQSVFAPGVIRELLRTLAVPVLLVPVPAARASAAVDRAETDVESADA
jgi:hypothetical protein